MAGLSTHFAGDEANLFQRLNRVAGQVEAVKQMVADDRACTEIVTQLRAARAAIRSLEANLLEGHLLACASAALEGASAHEIHDKISELKRLYKRYDD